MINSRRGRLIAFCGIDGAGKSSLVRTLAEEGAIEGAVYLHKERKTTTNAVVEYGLSDETGWHDWSHGPFAENVAAATAIDFLHHYEREIAPRLADGQLLVCDRYVLCYEAFLRAVGSRFRLGGIFERLHPPDLLIYVDASIETVVRRYEGRGGASEDEQPEAIRRFREAYLEIIEERPSEATFVLSNEGTFEEAYDAVRRRVDEQVARWD